MFVTMDVGFHEALMYFSYESEHQGEYHKEIQTLNFDDFYTSKASGFLDSCDQDVGNMDRSGITLD